MKDKIIQDPVHGYIKVDSMFIKIIDSIEFQRLKWVEQGSFRVLYPAARHDRFIHSLGTYFLAQKACKNFFKNIKEDIPKKYGCNKRIEEKLKNTFLYAALLHDIGHAPFSHTCEEYFRQKKDEKDQGPKIENDLIKAIKELGIDNEKKIAFEKEYKNGAKPKEHEIISATMLIKKSANFLGENIDKIDIELAVRMIIGLTYRNLRKEDGIKNCLIRLLNSSTVDVDKLDYISRDTKMMGFSNVTVDIERITNGVTAVVDSNEDLLPAFRKNTLSVIDNVFRAKEEQGRWVISHPIVVYESALIKKCVYEIDKDKSDEENQYIDSVFSYEALEKKGIIYKGKEYKLLSDIDIIADFKENLNNNYINEYFDRSCRRKPIWKSYYEYIHVIKQGKIDADINYFYRFFAPLIDYMDSENHFVLDDVVYEEIKKKAKDNVKRAADALNKICKDANIEMNFVLLEVKNNFISKISKQDIQIKFPNIKGLCSYDSIKGENKENIDSSIFFYLYSKESVDKKFIIKYIKEIMNSMRSV